MSQVQLLYLPEAAPRIHAYNPNAKLIAVLRNPIDRAYSDYWYARAKGWEPCPTFEEALMQESRRIHGLFNERVHLTYLHHGQYYDQLLHMLQLFDRFQILIKLTDDLRNDAKSAVIEIMEWLGLKSVAANIDFENTRNIAIMPKFFALQKALNVPHPAVRKAYHSLTPLALRLFVQRSIIRPIMRRNEEPFQYPPMQPETRRRLAEYFAPHNAKLSQLIGRDLSHWH